jgi:hypothetical protein
MKKARNIGFMIILMVLFFMVFLIALFDFVNNSAFIDIGLKAWQINAIVMAFALFAMGKVLYHIVKY